MNADVFKNKVRSKFVQITKKIDCKYYKVCG